MVCSDSIEFEPLFHACLHWVGLECGFMWSCALLASKFIILCLTHQHSFMVQNNCSSCEVVFQVSMHCCAEQELAAVAEAYSKFRDDGLPGLPGFTAGFVTYHAFSSWATTYLKQSYSLSAVFGASLCDAFNARGAVDV